MGQRKLNENSVVNGCRRNRIEKIPCRDTTSARELHRHAVRSGQCCYLCATPSADTSEKWEYLGTCMKRRGGRHTAQVVFQVY